MRRQSKRRGSSIDLRGSFFTRRERKWSAQRKGRITAMLLYCSKFLFFTLLFTSSAESFGGSSLRQRDILTSIYNDCDGENWSNNKHWLDVDIDICSWYGITCSTVSNLINSNGELAVVAIELQENKLSCALPSETFLMPYLDTLDLSHNPLVNVRFEELQNPTSLKSLLLSRIGVVSTDGIGSNMKRLKSLDISGNGITSKFPLEITLLSQLENLDISNNFFTGSLPESVGNLTSIKSFVASHNALTGQIPSSVDGMSSITVLDLSFNILSGTLPSAIGNLEKVSTLTLNDQAGVKIGGPLLDLARLSELSMLSLAHNSFTGSIPTTLLESADPNSFFTMIDLSSNKLEGVMPAELNRFLVLRIYAIDNKIDGIDPELCSLRHWFFNEVNSFGCDAILCPPATYSMFGRQTSKGNPCYSCPNGVNDAPYYGSTNCGGNWNLDKKTSSLSANSIFPSTNSSSFSTRSFTMYPSTTHINTKHPSTIPSPSPMKSFLESSIPTTEPPINSLLRRASSQPTADSIPKPDAPTLILEVRTQYLSTFRHDRDEKGTSMEDDNLLAPSGISRQRNTPPSSEATKIYHDCFAVELFFAAIIGYLTL